jgi:hypothetical protein
MLFYACIHTLTHTHMHTQYMFTNELQETVL